MDERFNGGGLLATDIAEILNRKPLSAASNRVGRATWCSRRGFSGRR